MDSPPGSLPIPWVPFWQVRCLGVSHMVPPLVDTATEHELADTPLVGVDPPLVGGPSL